MKNCQTQADKPVDARDGSGIEALSGPDQGKRLDDQIVKLLGAIVPNVVENLDRLDWNEVCEALL